MDLIAIAGSARTIANFVEVGGLSNTVAELGIQAAEDALSKVHHAEDKRSQVWSAVNHLEAAQVAVRDTLRRNDTVLFHLLPIKHDELRQKRAYIFGLQAICYRYLGEKELTDRALSAIDHIYADIFNVEGSADKKRWQTIRNVALLYSPLSWVDLERAEWQAWRGTTPPYEKDWLGLLAYEPYREGGSFTAALRRRLNATWQEAPGDLVSLGE
jgi:hypothetical protein